MGGRDSATGSKLAWQSTTQEPVWTSWRLKRWTKCIRDESSFGSMIYLELRIEFARCLTQQKSHCWHEFYCQCPSLVKFSNIFLHWFHRYWEYMSFPLIFPKDLALSGTCRSHLRHQIKDRKPLRAPFRLIRVSECKKRSPAVILLPKKLVMMKIAPNPQFSSYRGPQPLKMTRILFSLQWRNNMNIKFIFWPSFWALKPKNTPLKVFETLLKMSYFEPGACFLLHF